MFHFLKALGNYFTKTQLFFICSIALFDLLSIQIFNAQVFKVFHVFCDFEKTFRVDLCVVDIQRFNVSEKRKGFRSSVINIGASKVEHSQCLSAIRMNIVKKIIKNGLASI